jgi:6-phosphogluconolactonase
MARATLLSHAEIPPAQVHRMRGEASDPDQAAREYELELRAALGTPPRLDAVLLGLGADGHTASLFPRTPELLERERCVVASHAPGSGPPRITMTLPAIDAARRAIFLVAGNEKAAVLDAVLSLERPMPQLPASLVHLRDGSTLWLVDRAAASKIGS